MLEDAFEHVKRKGNARDELDEQEVSLIYYRDQDVLILTGRRESNPIMDQTTCKFPSFTSSS